LDIEVSGGLFVSSWNFRFRKGITGLSSMVFCDPASAAVSTLLDDARTGDDVRKTNKLGCPHKAFFEVLTSTSEYIFALFLSFYPFLRLELHNSNICTFVCPHIRSYF
jgi:hypothetical protein